MTVFEAHETPNISVSSFRFLMAASLMEKMLSLSQAIQIGESFSLKKASPNYLAKMGNCWTTDCLILQFLSWDNSERAGMIDCERFSMPSTLFSSSRRLKRFSLTSDESSLSKAKKIGKMCSLVLPLSITAQRARTFSASALFTYWKESTCNFFKQGMILTIMLYASRMRQNSASREAAAVRTSDSESERKPTK